MKGVEVDEPVNIMERYLYGINVRLDAIIDMLSSAISVYANQNNVAITRNEIMIEKPKRTRSKK